MITLTMKQAITAAMQMLTTDPRVVFVGQNVCYSGHVVYETVKDIPESRRLEVPVAEAMQMGIATGMALAGLVPVSIYPRIDFLLLACDQLVNHLDKLAEMSQGQYNPKVIIRTMLGNTSPLHPGPQHSQNHTQAFRSLLKHTKIWTLEAPEDAMTVYRLALECDGPVLVIEAAYR